MTSKVFLFDKHNWLYCSDVSFKDGVWRGWVVNGAWHLVYNTVDKSFKCYRDSADERADYLPINEDTATLTWMCDPVKGCNYDKVIADAEIRYEENEPAVFEIGVDKNFALYQKLKAKYENDDEFDLYLELREKYEDDGIPF
jgi:hypothetical protein